MTNKIKNLLEKLKKKLKPDQLADQTSSIDIESTNDSLLINPEELKNETFADKVKAKINYLKAKFDGKRLRPFSSKEGSTSLDLKEGLNITLLSPRLNIFLDKILHQSARTAIHQFFLIALISTLAYSFGKISSLFVSGNPSIDSSKDYQVSLNTDKSFNPDKLTIIKSNDLFKTNKGTSKKPVGIETKCETAQSSSKLPIKLINTVVLQDSIKSIASVQIRGDRKLEEIREGDVISNMAKVFKIDRLELIIKNLESGTCESISSSKAENLKGSNKISLMSKGQARDFLKNKKMSGIDNEGNKFNISKNLLDDKLKDIASILTQARAVKIQNNDGSIAFKLTEIDPEGIFPYLGLQDEDIITAINGKPIYDMNEVMTLFGKIKTVDNLSLGVRREGSDSVQEYSIKK